MNEIIATILRQPVKLFRYFLSELRKFKCRLLYPNCRFGRGVYLGPRAIVKTTDGGSIMIGNNSVIERNCFIVATRGHIEIGSDCFIGQGSFICANESIQIGNFALIAEYVTIRDQNHGTDVGDVPFCHQPSSSEPISIANNVWLGAKSTVVAGSRIEENVICAAGAVVVCKKISANSVVGGVPAKTIKKINS